MFTTSLRQDGVRLLLAPALFAVALLCAPPSASAQDSGQTTGDAATPAATVATTPTQDEPLYHDYKGVKLGMSADDVRKKLGRPKDAGKEQDFFVFSDRERARVYYDDKGKASAIIVTYIGKSSSAPTPEAILGAALDAKADGSMYRLVQYPKSGYWVAYSRTAGDEPLTMVTMQKMSAQ
jgi:hypothetical protein